MEEELTAAAYIAIYAGLLIFLAGCMRRIVQYARTPLHLRWELYPLPHEHPYRAAYGGSYFETQEWWRRPQVRNRRGEISVMVEEVVFLKGLRQFNRRLWLPSFLFHAGLYLTIGAIALMLAGALASGFSAAVHVPGLAAAFSRVGSGCGLAAAALVIAGACLLLARRISDSALRNSTHAGDIANLLLFIFAFSLIAAGALVHGPNAATPGEFARGVLHFDRRLQVAPIFGAGIILASALAAYIPFTHMAHFIAKYFTWHAVRWDDRRTEAGGTLEARMALNLSRRPTWSAPHIGADGRRSWAEIAASAPKETKK